MISTMKTLVFFAVTLATGVFGTEEDDPVNTFKGYLLNKVEELKLDPGHPSGFSFSFRCNSFKLAPIYANFNKGTLTGLGENVDRLGECDPVKYVNGIAVVECNFDFSGLKVTYDTVLREGRTQVIRRVKSVLVDNSKGRVEIHADPGHENSKLVSLEIKNIHVKAQPFLVCKSNEDKTKEVIKEFERNAADKIKKYLNEYFKPALSDAISRIDIDSFSYL